MILKLISSGYMKSVYKHRVFSANWSSQRAFYRKEEISWWSYSYPSFSENNLSSSWVGPYDSCSVLWGKK